jgi:hypothetical protein
VQFIFPGSGLTELRTVPVRFTRLQYAKTMYQDFHIPKKFHEASRVVGGAENRKLTESFDIGCRLMCGIESAYQRSKAENAKKFTNSVSSAQSTRESEMKKNTKCEIFSSTLHRDSSDFQLMIDTLLDFKEVKKENSTMKDNSSLSEIRISKDLLEKYHSLCKTLEPDSDSWMFLSPEELDAEMTARVKKYKGDDAAACKSSNTSDEKEKDILKNGLYSPKNSESLQKNMNVDSLEKDGKPAPKANSTGNDQLQKMLDGMKSFMSTKSDVGGIVSLRDKKDKDSTGSKEKNAVINDKISEIKNNNLNSDIGNEKEVDGGDDTNEYLEIDFEKLIGYINNTNTNNYTNTNTNFPKDNAHSTEQKDQEHSLNMKDAPLGDYFYDDDLIETSSGESSDDSDDEDDGNIKPQNGQNNTKNEKPILSDNITVLNYDRTGRTDTVENIRNAQDRKETVSVSTVGMRTVQFATSRTSSCARDSKAQKISHLNSHDTDRRKDAAADGDIMSSVSGISNLTLLSSAAIDSSRGPSRDDSSIAVQGDSYLSSDPRAAQSGPRAMSRESECDSDDDDSFYDDSETDSDDEPLGGPLPRSRGGTGEGGGRGGENTRSMDPSHEHDPLSDDVDIGCNGSEEEDEDDGSYLKEYEVRYSTVQHAHCTVLFRGIMCLFQWFHLFIHPCFPSSK